MELEGLTINELDKVFEEALKKLVDQFVDTNSVDEFAAIKCAYECLSHKFKTLVKKEEQTDTALTKLAKLVGYEYNYCSNHNRDEKGICRGSNCAYCWKEWALDGGKGNES